MSAATLRGVRVVDLSSPVGTYCTRILSDLGADVVLVEPPGATRTGGSGLSAPVRRDPRRVSHSVTTRRASAASCSTLMTPTSGPSSSVSSAGADVVVISPSPERPMPGFDTTTGELDSASPAAIVCSVTPFGVTGPYARRRATHLTSSPRAGGCGAPVPRGRHRSRCHRTCTGTSRQHTQWIAILAALRVREQVGGQFIDISAQEVEQYQEVLWEAYHFQGLRPGGRTIPIGVPPTGVWECRDGLFDVAAHQVQHWEAFLELLDHPPELAEPALADMATRQLIFDGVAEIIESLLAPLSRYEFFERGQRIGLPVGLLNTPAQFVADEQLAAPRLLRRPRATRDRPTIHTPGPTTTDGAEALRSWKTHAAAWRARARAAGGGPERPTRCTIVGRRPVAGAAPRGRSRPLAGGLRRRQLQTAQILAALGAEVVKVESRSRPSNVRTQPFNDAPTLAVEPSGTTITPMYASLSRGMLGVAIEMGHDDGHAVFRRLATVSDVVLENFGAGVMANWGCWSDDLRTLNPQLVMVSLSGYGRTGPRASYTRTDRTSPTSPASVTSGGRTRPTGTSSPPPMRRVRSWPLPTRRRGRRRRARRCVTGRGRGVDGGLAVPRRAGQRGLDRRVD